MLSDDAGSPQRPIHISNRTWDDETHLLEDSIRRDQAFEGRWQSYIDNDLRIVVPEKLRHIFNSGGVITTGTDHYLMIFGTRHWERHQRLLAKSVGLEVINNDLARHTYENMHRFKLDINGCFTIPLELADYAELHDELAIIGMIYHGEIYNKTNYKMSRNSATTESRLELFKKLRFN